MRTFAEQPKTSQPATSTGTESPMGTRRGQSRDAASILHLQRTIGNRAVQRQLYKERSGVTVPEQIRAASTPEEMPDRIPPRVNTPVDIEISGLAEDAPPVKLGVYGDSESDGEVTINGAENVELRASATVQLRGKSQTERGKGGNLRLVAFQGEFLRGMSSGFSVSSVPQNWSTELREGVRDNGEIGMIVDNCWESDSGNLDDLDLVQRREHLEMTEASGPWEKRVLSPTGGSSGARGCNEDQHLDRQANIREPGVNVVRQIFVFNCKRTGATDIPSKNSGFVIARVVTRVDDSLSYSINKKGYAVTMKSSSGSTLVDAAHGHAGFGPVSWTHHP